MTTQQIFGLQVLLSFILFTMVARWYVSPRLAALPVDRALQPLLVLHATRHMGLVFLVPTVVGGTLPAAFAAAAAYGDLLAGVLALAALVALRARSGGAMPLTWLFNVVGLLDLVNAFYQGLTHDVQLGAAYYIPTFIVPALVVTHVMMFGLLLRHPTSARLDLPAS
jgi:hypothetical protein